MRLTDAQAVQVGLTPRPGIYLNAPDDEYFRWPYLSKSGLSKFVVSAAEHRAYIDGLLEYKSSDSMLLGSAVDCLWFFGTDALLRAFATEPHPTPLKKNGQPYSNWLSSKPGVQWASEMAATGLRVLPKGLEQKALAIVQRLDEHASTDGTPSAAQLREQGTAQVSIVWDCPHTGLRLKGRPDLVDFERLVISDLKTAVDVSPSGFAAAIGRYDYHWQAHLYRQGLAVLTGTDPWDWATKWIAVRNTPVHSVEIYSAGHDTMLQAEQEVTYQLTRYRHCVLKDDWPADSGIEKMIDLPNWRKK